MEVWDGMCVCACMSVNVYLCSFQRAFCDLSVLEQQSERSKVRVLFSVQNRIPVKANSPL